MGGTHTRDTGGKDRKAVPPYLLRVSARFLLSTVRAIKLRQMKFDWGQSRDCVKNSVIHSELHSTIYVQGLQGYGDAKLSGSAWLAKGGLVHGDSHSTRKQTSQFC